MSERADIVARLREMAESIDPAKPWQAKRDTARFLLGVATLIELEAPCDASAATVAEAPSDAPGTATPGDASRAPSESSTNDPVRIADVGQRIECDPNWKPPFCANDADLACPVCNEANAVRVREKETYYDGQDYEAYCAECHAELTVYAAVDVAFCEAEPVEQ